MARILVIDDDARMRDFLAELLEDEGYEVVVAADGAMGLQLFRERAADVVITDIIMPGTEGMETIYQLREDAPDVPIIAISGGSPKGVGSYLQTAAELGANQTFSKPFNSKTLIDAVAKLLHNASSTIEH
jgi:CheY-like chemotaxis protein